MTARALWVVLVSVLVACGRPAARAPVAKAAPVVTEPPQPPGVRYGEALAAAMSDHDAERFARQFAVDSALTVVGEQDSWVGRRAILEAAEDLIARFPDMRVVVGRTWSSAAASVIEVVITATHDEHPIGVVGAIVVEPDPEGRIAWARLYVDLITVVGQIDPSQLGKGAKIRAPVSTPPVGTAAMVSTHTTKERDNLDAAGRILEDLVARDAERVLAASSDDYVYDDFAGPAPLDLAGTKKLLKGFFKKTKAFTIVVTPTFFAAGDDVVIEQVERVTLGRSVMTLYSLDIKHFKDGYVTGDWQYADSTPIVRRGGQIPSLPEPAVKK